MQQQTQPVTDYPCRSSSNAALDPTGMFRNRGRRVIAPSSAGGGVPVVQKNNECTVIPPSSSYATLSMTSPNDRVGHVVDDRQIINDLPQHTTIRVKSEEQSLMLSELQNMDAMNDDSIAPPSTLPSFRREDDVQPEIDHPPQQQSISLMNLSDSVNYSIQSSQHNDERLDNNSHNNDINRSNSMTNNSSEHEQLSTISSTASIMGSIIDNQGDEYSSSLTYEDVQLLAVKRRMMEDVDEVTDEENINKATSDDDDDDSLECHADNTDSFRSDEDNSTIIKESNTLLFQCEVANDIDVDQQKASNVIHVADFSSDPNAISKCRSASPNNAEHKSHLPQLEFRRGTSVMSAPSEAFLVENPFRRQNDETPSTPSDVFLNEPYAFLRKRSSERLKRLSPTKFQLSAASSSAIDKAVTTAGLLPQLARQCFSVEDTAVNDGTFLAPMPDLLSGSGGEVGGTPTTTTQKYYGLCSASFVIDEDDDQVEKENDYRLDYRPAFGATDFREFDVRKKQCHELSPSHRKSRTWNESLPKASSFDAWSPARGGVKKPLMEEIDTIVNSYNGEQRKYKNIEDWKVSDMCTVGN